jgi:phosphatidylglycerophosphate synthase
MRNWLKEYRASLKAVEVEETLDLWIYRPLGFLVVKAVQHTRITPNQLTMMALVAGMIAGFAFAAGTQASFLAGALLYFLFNVLDCSDGQLARLKRNGTAAGRIIDGVADYIAGIFILIGLGIGFMSHTSSPMLWWLLLLLGSVSNVLHSIVTDNERNRFMKHAWGKKDEFNESLAEYGSELQRLQKEPAGQRFSIIILKIYLGYMKLAGQFNRQPEQTGPAYDPQLYYTHNRRMIKAWTFLGPTTHITIVVIGGLFFAPHWAALTMLVPMNIYWLVLFVIQQRILARISDNTKYLTPTPR